MIVITVYKYRIYCTTDQQWEYVWSASAPSTCPINATHSVNSSSVSEDDQIQVSQISSSDSPYEIKQTSVFCDTIGGNIILNLPKAARCTDMDYVIKKITNTNTVTIIPFGSDQIDGSSNKILSALNQTVMLQSNGTTWTSTSYYDILPISSQQKPSTFVATRSKGDILVDSGGELIPLNVGTNNYSLVADSTQTLGVKWGQIDHTSLLNIGTNTHAQIDTHISSTVGIHGITGSFVGTSDTQTLSNKSLINNSVYHVDLTDITKKIGFDTSNATASTTMILSSSHTANRTLTLPDTTDTIIGKSTTDVLLNKSLSNSTTFLVDATDNSKKLNFNTSGATPTTVMTLSSNQTVSRTLTLPNATDTLVGRSTTDTLINKTLTAPTIATINNGGILTLPTGPNNILSADSIDTITNKKITDSNCYVVNNLDSTKLVRFDLNGLTTSTTRVVTVPDTDLTLVGVDTTQVLTNKTLTDPKISTIINTGTLTLPTSTDNLVGRNTTDTLTNKTLTAPKISTISNTGVITVPTTTDTLVGEITTATLSNKNLLNNTVYHIDNTDVSKRIAFKSSGATTATTLTIAGIQSVNRTLTLPDADDTLIGQTTSATLTNKTLTSPIISTIINTGTLTLPVSTDTLVGRSTTDTLVNKTLTNPVIGTIINSGTILLPSSSDTLVGKTTVDTLSNKSFVDVLSKFVDALDNTVHLHFDVSGTTNTNTVLSTHQTSNQIITLPDATDTLVGKATVDTLTNKTLTSPVISVILNTGTITLPTTTDTLIGRDTTDTLTNKTLVLPNIHTIINTGTLTLPTSTDTLMGRTTADTISNKTFADNLNMATNKIVNLGIPSQPNDAASKQYVDSVTSGLTVKQAVEVATTADLSANTSITGLAYDPSGGAAGKGQFTATLVVSGVFIVDGYTMNQTQDENRLLLKNQTSGEQNGIYTSDISGTSLVLDRSTDFDSDLEAASGAFVFVIEGTENVTTGWVLATSNPIVLGVTPLTFSQFSGAGQIVPGTGMTKSGNTLNVNGSTTIHADADALHVNSTAIANQILLSSGTINTQAVYGALPLGDSNAVTGTLTVTNGGTGSSSFGAGDRLIATNSGNTALISTSLNPANIVTLTDTQTLVNKTLTGSNIAFVMNVGTITFPTTSDILVGTLTEDVLYNKTLDHATTLIGDINHLTYLKFDTSGAIDTTTLTLASQQTLNRTLTLPDANDTLVGRNTTDTLTNKTFTNPSIPIIINTGTLTLPTTTDTLVAQTTPANLTNKSLEDNTTFFYDNVDPTKKLQFQLANITTSTTRTLTIPDASTTIVGTDATQTLTNKTLTSPIIGTIVNTGTLTLPVSTDTLIGRSTTDTMINKSFVDSSTAIVDISDNTKQIKFDAAGTTSTATTILSSQTTNITVTLPNATDTLVGRTTTDTLSNKTITFPNITTINAGGTLTLPTTTDTLIGRSTTDTLTNKTFVDNTTSFIDDGNNTRVMQFELSGITAGTTRVLTIPDQSTTIVGTNVTQTLTNKTLTTPTIATILNSGALTLPTGTDTITAIAATQTLTNKTLSDSTTNIANVTFPTKTLGFSIAGSTGTTTVLSTSQTANRTVTLPDATDTLVGKATTDTFTNKLFSTSTCLFASNTDLTKLLKFDLSGATSTTTLTLVSSHTGNNIITIPNIAADTLVGRNTTDTLTNKTLTFPTISSIINGTATLTMPTTTDTLVGISATQTLFNKSLVDSSTFFIDNLDNTRMLQLQLSGITSGTTRTLTVPDANTTIVGTDTTQTLTNKTLTDPTIARIFNTGTLVLPVSSDTLVGRITTDTISNKSLKNDTCFFVDPSDTTKKIGFSTSTAIGTTTLTILSAQTVNRTITIPNATDTLVALSTTDTLSNKTLRPASCTFIDVSSQVLSFQLTGATSSTITTIAATSTVNRTITLPNTTDTLVGLTTTSTLTNKTLTDPNIIRIFNTGTLTLPTTSDTLIGRATTDTLTNKIITGTTNTVAATQLRSTGPSGDVIISVTAPTIGQVLKATGVNAAAWSNSERWIFRDERTTGTAGGTFTSAEWRTRTINTTSYNGGGNVTLATNQLTFAAGTYRVKASAVGNQCGTHQTRIQNITGGTTTAYGLVMKPSGADQLSSDVECVFTVASSTVFELQHRCTITRLTNGFGVASGFGGTTEVYANIFIEKL